MNKKMSKVIIRSLEQDLKNLKKYNYYTQPENIEYYNNLCNVILSALKNFKKTI